MTMVRNIGAALATPALQNSTLAYRCCTAHCKVDVYNFSLSLTTPKWVLWQKLFVLCVCVHASDTKLCPCLWRKTHLPLTLSARLSTILSHTGISHCGCQIMINVFPVNHCCSGNVCHAIAVPNLCSCADVLLQNFADMNQNAAKLSIRQLGFSSYSIYISSFNTTYLSYFPLHINSGQFNERQRSDSNCCEFHSSVTWVTWTKWT